MRLNEKKWWLLPAVWFIGTFAVTLVYMTISHIVAEIPIEELENSNCLRAYCISLMGGIGYLLYVKDGIHGYREDCIEVGLKQAAAFCASAAGIAFILSGIGLFLSGNMGLGFIGVPFSEIIADSAESVVKTSFMYTVLAPVGEVVALSVFIFSPLRRKLNFWLAALLSGLLFALAFAELRWELIYMIPIGLLLLFILEKTNNITVSVLALQSYYISALLLQLLVGEKVSVILQILLQMCGFVLCFMAVALYKSNSIFTSAYHGETSIRKLNCIEYALIFLLTAEVLRRQPFADSDLLHILTVCIFIVAIGCFCVGRNYNEQSEKLFSVQYMVILAYILIFMDDNIFLMDYVYAIAKLGGWVYLLIFLTSIAPERKLALRNICALLICVWLGATVVMLIAFLLVGKDEFMIIYCIISAASVLIYIASIFAVRERIKLLQAERREI